MQATEPISITASITILKPAPEVFGAILNPAPFFIQRASAPLSEDADVLWTFAETDTAVPVRGKKIVPNELVRFEWGAAGGGRNTVEFRLQNPQELNPAARPSGPATTVTVTESGWPADEKGRAASYGNTMGWTQMICSLKAWLEHRVNLREGAFIHYKF
ncbi:MAG: SRPBCC domain-containing protein [Elusimicrobia bacterium]|nr:SRPBCC domain-containing protein [Elusimicrobiota bacterium]